MKHIKLLFVLFIVCVTLSSCATFINQPRKYFGFDLTSFTVIEENDTHGGFHGDGYYYFTLDCSSNTYHAYELIQNWNDLPLSENLYLVMYGGEKDEVNYGHNFADKAHWPTVTNGVYKFVDRHSEATNESDDTDLLTRFSYNFSVAVYDFDTNRLYYFEVDT